MPTKAELEKLIQKCIQDKGWSKERCQRYIAGGIWGGEFITPQPSDVHITGAMKVKPEKKKNQTFSFIGIPIFKAGFWKNTNFTIDDLEELVQNTNSLINSHLHEPPIKLGHSENQEILSKEGLPSAGYVSRVYRLGNQVFADITNIPKQIADLIEKRAYSKISAEIYEEFKHPETQENIGKVLRAVALLGADIPEVKGLGDIQRLYHAEGNYNYIVFSERDLKEVNEMVNVWSLEDVKNYFPCCIDAVKNYMEKNKKETIEMDKLAEIIANVRLSKLQEQEPECPPGFKWDTKLSRCVAEDTKSEQPSETKKQQEQKVCPKNYKWDDAEQKCIPIEVEKTQEEVSKPDELEIPDELKDLLKTDKINQNDMYDQLEKLQKELSIEKAQEEVKKFQLPGGTPRGWEKGSFQSAFESLGGTFRSCVKNISDVVDDPDKFCAWLKHRATGEWPGTAEWRAEENPKEKEKDKEKIKELIEKVKQYETEKKNKLIQELIEKNRGILLPKFDEYIKVFTENLDISNTIKFGEQQLTMFDIFYKFLKEFTESKAVIFEELAKVPKEVEIPEISEEEKDKVISKYSEIRPGEKVENLDLALLAEKIAKKQNVSYRDALVKASRLLNKESEVK